MKIKELVISESCLGFPYITEKITGNKMSDNRRLITDNEIIGLFINYLNRECVNKKSSEIHITDNKQKKLFSVKIQGRLLRDVKNELKNIESMINNSGQNND